MQNREQYADAKLMQKMFSGLQRGYGLWNGKKDYNFKHIPLTLQHYKDHLEGKHSLGVVPINDEGYSNFGAIDFDDHHNKPEGYKFNYDLLLQKINYIGLPLTLFKSKGGGAHAYMFCDKMYKAGDIIHILKKMAYALGCPRDIEIFPKQKTLFDEKGNRKDGNYINLPYHNGNTRVLLNHEGSELNATEGLLYASERLTNSEEMEKFKLLDHGKSTGRNDRTMSYGIFAKHFYPDRYEQFVIDYNKLFNVPPINEKDTDSPTRLEDTILSSLRKKDYTKKKNEPAPNAWQQGTRAKDIRATHYEPLDPIVEGLIFTGITFITGKSKLGKSWFALQLAHAVETGGKILNCQCVQGDVLHYSLEDGRRRNQSRWNTMGIKPENALYQFRDRKPKIPLLTLGLEEEIEDWIKNTPNPKLVIIDPYVKAKKTLGGKNMNAYENDNYNLQDIYTLANKYNIAVVFLHHTKKKSENDVFDEMNGSSGIQSNCDSMIVLSSQRKVGQNVTLSCLPKDAEQKEFEIALSGNCTWEYVGKCGQAGQTKIKKAIIEAIKFLERDEAGAPASDIKDYVTALDDEWKRDRVGTELTRLAEDGEIFKIRKGVYKSANY